MSDTTYLHVFFRNYSEAEFVHAKIEVPMNECNDYEAMSTNDLMAAAVRHEFAHENGYFRDFHPDCTAEVIIADNIQNGYDLITAFFGDVHFVH